MVQKTLHVPRNCLLFRIMPRVKWFHGIRMRKIYHLFNSAQSRNYLVIALPFLAVRSTSSPLFLLLLDILRYDRALYSQHTAARCPADLGSTSAICSHLGTLVMWDSFVSVKVCDLNVLMSEVYCYISEVFYMFISVLVTVEGRALGFCIKHLLTLRKAFIF